MRNISFMLTQQQIRERTKTVTRRVGWEKLQAGELLRGVEKGMGLKAGEKVVPLATIRVVSARREALSAMTADVDYGFAECAKEGFGGGQAHLWSSSATLTEDARRRPWSLGSNSNTWIEKEVQPAHGTC